VEPQPVQAQRAETGHALSGAFIGIGGLIGAGKSTLAGELGKRLQLDVHFGPSIDDELRDVLLSEPERHSFAVQVDLLNQRFKQHQEISWSGRGGVQDRTLLEDLAYTRVLYGQGVLTRREHGIYMDLYHSMSRAMARPDLLVFLEVLPETAKERIVGRMRGRQVEVSLAFLEALHDCYEVLVDEVSRTLPVIRVPYDRLWNPDVLTHALCESYAQMGCLRELRATGLAAPPSGGPADA
jgi:deoxyadenosine/deoxycytidine kinase